MQFRVVETQTDEWTNSPITFNRALAVVWCTVCEWSVSQNICVSVPAAVGHWVVAWPLFRKTVFFVFLALIVIDPDSLKYSSLVLIKKNINIMSNLLYLLVLFASGSKICSAVKDYCSTNNFDNISAGMQFTKEPNNGEFAIAGKFKEIHCCAKGYSSIEWYKDGRPYPWSLDLSTLVIFPESANQTIYTPSVRHADSGNYTCVLRDEQRNHDIIFSHKTVLTVFDRAPDDPKITFISPNRIPHTGDSLRLFCEAFGGTVDLPDAYNEAVWHKELSNGTLIKLPQRLFQEKTSREDGQTFGTYLKFDNFQLEDAGTYVCVIRKPGVSVQERVIIRDAAVFYVDPNPFPWKAITIACLVIATLIMSIIVLNKKYGPRVKELVKDNCYAIEENDGKATDVLIAYSAEDSEIANEIMLPKLEAKSYTCTSRKITCDITKCAAEISHYAESSRRIIVILSPAALNDIWTSAQLYQVLKHFQTIDSCKIVYVTVRSFPVSGAEVKNHSGESLRSLISDMNIIQWNVSKDANFWFRLCSELPPKRNKCWGNSKNEERLA